MDVTDCLTRVRAGVEDDPVTVAGDALSDRYLMGVRDEVGQQPCLGGGEFGQVRVMCARNHEYVNRRLRVDIAKRQSSRIG